MHDHKKLREDGNKERLGMYVLVTPFWTKGYLLVQWQMKAGFASY